MKNLNNIKTAFSKTIVSYFNIDSTVLKYLRSKSAITTAQLKLSCTLKQVSKSSSLLKIIKKNKQNNKCLFRLSYIISQDGHYQMRGLSGLFLHH